MSTPAAYVPPIDQPPPLAADTVPYGGFWIRFAAYWVDGLLVGLLAFLIGIAWVLALGAEGTAGSLLPFVGLVVGQLYHAYFVSSEKMATPGKRWCGLYVTDVEGRRLGFGRALWRNVAALFSYLTLYIGFFMAGFTGKKQALHDKLAGTIVHRQPGSSAGVLIVVIVVVIFGVAILGILAAIAIPAYQDYTIRAKTTGVITAMAGAKTAVAAYRADHGAWPTSWDQVPGGDPSAQLGPEARTILQSFELGPNGAIVATVTVAKQTGAIVLTTEDGGATWSCASDAAIRKYVPAACRD